MATPPEEFSIAASDRHGRAHLTLRGELDLGEDRLERRQVAVDVVESRDPHAAIVADPSP